MNNRFVELSTRTAAAVLFCCVLSLVTGCSTSKFLSQPSVGAVSGAAIQGRVHGGQQPVSGATIQLWAVGTTGYGSAAAPLLGSHVVTTAADGSFSISGDYSCPAGASNGDGNAYVYITATGGNPGLSGSNPNLKLAAALGNCGALTSGTFISMNEVTTAAAAYALGQYFNISTGSFGAPNTTQGQIGLVNAFATVNSLVSLATGNAITSANLPVSCTTSTVASPCVTATPESAKLNTVADILAACVNSLGVSDPGNTSCTTLFGAVVPNPGTAPTDTLQAAADMSLNPTSNNANGSTTNLAALYALVTGQAPYIGVSTQPTDWTVGIQYVDATANTFYLQPENVAADGNGNIWVLNSSGNSSTNTGSLVEVSPSGAPMQNLLTSATAGVGINAAQPHNLAIDLNGDAWVTTSTSSAYIFEVNSAGANVTGSPYGTSKSSYGLAIDGNNNVFVGQASTSAHFEVYEFPATVVNIGAPNTANLATPIVYPIAGPTPGTAGTNGTNSFVLPQYMAFDTNGNLWMTNGSATTGTTSNQVVELTNINISQCNPTYVTPAPCPAGGTGVTNIPLTTSATENTFTAINPVTMSAPFGIAANTNGMWIANSTNGADAISNIALTGTAGSNYGSSTSLTASLRYVVVDGAGNVWVTNKGGSPTGIVELNSAGTVLSPVNSGVTNFTSIGFVHPGLNTSLGVAIDPSGNVWVANNTATAGIFELVGAAAPTITPLAAQLKSPATPGQKP